MGKAGVAMATEVALADQAVRCPVEESSPLLQFPHPFGSLLGVQLRHPPVIEQLAAAHGVAKMDLPVVLGPQVAHRSSDAALGHDRVSLAQKALAYHRRLRAGVMSSDRR